MKKNRIHRVIVEDTKNTTFTGFVTYETIFDYFFNNYYSDMDAFHININNVSIATANMISVCKNETILNCIMKFLDHKISILPIIEDGGGYFGFFFLKDIIYMFANGENFEVRFIY